MEPEISQQDDAWLRSVFRRAGDSIDVETPTQWRDAGQPRRPRWRLVAVAAVLLVVVAAGAVLYVDRKDSTPVDAGPEPAADVWQREEGVWRMPAPRSSFRVTGVQLRF